MWMFYIVKEGSSAPKFLHEIYLIYFIEDGLNEIYI